MDGNAVKNGLSFVLALAVIAVLGAGVLLLTGRYTYGEALTGGFAQRSAVRWAR